MLRPHLIETTRCGPPQDSIEHDFDPNAGAAVWLTAEVGALTKKTDPQSSHQARRAMRIRSPLPTVI